VNFPSTEYLELPFVDFLCFNVYLEERERLEAYLARLHTLAGERPLVMAEIGLDSRRNGEAAQAQTLGWQVEAAFEAGAAGAFIFAWTDEWYITHLDASGRGQGGSAIEDWDFGLTDRDRRPKPALGAVREAFARVPIAPRADWPRVSVVVCSFNGERTLADTLAGVCALEYPDCEVIVVDDGSTDETAAIAARFGARVVSTENRGLSSARNTGMSEATGEIVAYTDDDARPDPHWLVYLVTAFRAGHHAAVGGPNLPPPDGLVPACVAAAPGGPQHVLLSDNEAEHIPGCNAAFLRRALHEVGGFDLRFRVAGDDVDLCWRLQDAGHTIGFAPAAVVWHHPRTSVRAYLRQQRGYGKAEAMLERKWPERYNPTGHLSWRGRLYGRGVFPALRRRTRVYHGSWNTGLFQSLYDGPPGRFNQLAQTPEWALIIAVLGAISLQGLHWRPLVAAFPLVVAAIAALVAQAVLGALRAPLPAEYRGPLAWRARALTALLFAVQPIARLRGRLAEGLTPWRRRATCGLTLPWPRSFAIWSTSWRAPEAWLSDMERSIRAAYISTIRGGDFDSWDLEIRGGMVGAARLTAAVEEHGAGLQMVRFRVAPRISAVAGLLLLLFGILALGAVLDSSWIAGGVLAALATAMVAELVVECGQACAAARPSPTASAAALEAVEQREPAGVDM
jgi:glycosyltransferase involved in cell wall biosynthesis